MADEKCLFCEIVKGAIPSLKIYENESIIGVLNIHPGSKGQILVITKKHHNFMQTLNEKETFDLMNAIKVISTIMTQILNPIGINVLYSMGSFAGQKVGHVSFDIIPRYSKDKIKIEIPELKLKEQELYDTQKLYVNAFQKSTIELLKAIKDGKIKVSEEVKKQAINTLEKLNKNKPKKNPLKKENKVDLFKLEDELKKL